MADIILLPVPVGWDMTLVSFFRIWFLSRHGEEEDWTFDRLHILAACGSGELLLPHPH